MKKRAALVCCQYPRTKVGLLLCRGSLFVVVAALVIGAGVSSQYHPPVTNAGTTLSALLMTLVLMMSWSPLRFLSQCTVKQIVFQVFYLPYIIANTNTPHQ